MPKPELALKEMVRVMKPEARLMIIDPLAPESDPKFELHNRIEKIRDPSHAETLRLTTFLALFDQCGLTVARQAIKRRPRSFHQWMVRAGLEPTHKRYLEARRLMEDSIPGDRTGFSPQLDGHDLRIVHHEGMFLLVGGRS
jgi:ubiquinone/menaquinone biosynthesis C-methylase UbiE